MRTGHYLGSWYEPGIKAAVRLRVEFPREVRIAPLAAQMLLQQRKGAKNSKVRSTVTGQPE